MKRIVILGLTAVLSLAAIACTGASADGNVDPTTTPPGVAVGEPAPGTGGGVETPQPLPDGEMETRVVTAPILESEVQVRESMPPQYAVRVLAEIGDGCHAYESTEVERNGTTIEITVLRTAPAHPELVLCTMIYQTHEESVDLGSDFESGTEYTVILNDGEQTLTFTAQ